MEVKDTHAPKEIIAKYVSFDGIQEWRTCKAITRDQEQRILEILRENDTEDNNDER